MSDDLFVIDTKGSAANGHESQSSNRDSANGSRTNMNRKFSTPPSGPSHSDRKRKVPATHDDEELEIFVDRQGTSLSKQDQSESVLNESGSIMYMTGSSLVLGVDPDTSIEDAAGQQPARKNRRPFFPKQVNKRYHEVGEGNSSNFKPGQISDNLREALGISSNQLPIYIYRMRSLGYPPGWLRKAQVERSELSIIDSSTEESDASAAHPIAVEYREGELITFPGFNAWPDRSVKEECVLLGSPPQRPLDLLPQFIAQLRSAMKSGRGRDTSMTQQDQTARRPTAPLANMELVDDNEREEPAKSFSSVSEQQPAGTGEELDELEAQRQWILLQLGGQDANTTNSEKEAGNTESQITASPPGDCPSSPSPHLTDGNTPARAIPLDQAATAQEEPVSVPDLGSPAFLSTPNRRPELERFSEGIQAYRPYENLPGSTGCYKKVQQALMSRQKKVKQ